MSSHSHIEGDDTFGGDFAAASPTRVTGSKREFGDIDDEDIFGSKKANIKAEETAPSVATGMILSLRESLQSCKDTLATCQSELEAAKSEVQKWHSAFLKESIPSGSSVEPRIVISYLQNLKSSEESLREQLEKAKKRELAIAMTMAKRDQEIVSLKSELEAAKSEVQKWHSAFQKESFILPGVSVEPRVVISYIKNLKSSEESLREQLEKAKKTETAFVATTKKHEQEITDSKGIDKNNDKTAPNVTPTITTTKATPRKTVWDSTTHNIFLELCLDEVRKGNKPRSHFNKAGWANLGKNLKDRTGKSYSKLQLKNHWDSMKRDWKLYNRLMSLMSVESELEWDPVRKTINATPEWWDEKMQAEPDLVKFKDRNMEMYQLYYDPLFRDFAAIGDRTDPQLLIENDVQDENGVADLEEKVISDDVNLVGDDEEILLPESSSTKIKKTQNITPICSNKEKPLMDSSFEVKFDTLLQVLSSRSAQSYPLPSSIPSLSACMGLLSGQPDFEPGSKCYNKALRIFWKEEARESFMYPSSIEGKIAFLKSLME